MRKVRNISKDKVQLVLDWCEKEFGKSKYQIDFPKLVVYKSRGCYTKDFKYIKNGLFGYFKENKIRIFLGSHKSIRELCLTVLHEYKHYLLDIEKYTEIYFKMKINGRDDDYIASHHLHEKLCEKFEKTHIDKCFNQLKNKIYN